MGTAGACIYASLYYAWKEIHDILLKFQRQLYFHKRYFDDIFGIWIGNNNDEWVDFKRELNNFKPGILEWEVSTLSTSVNFLDLNISIKHDGYITTKTFQKKYNLHLYVPAHSAHPPGSLKSLIYNTLATYWDQNTNPDDYQHFAGLLFNRLTVRGYNDEELTGHFRSAPTHIDTLVSTNGQAVRNRDKEQQRM